MTAFTVIFHFMLEMGAGGAAAPATTSPFYFRLYVLNRAH